MSEKMSVSEALRIAKTHDTTMGFWRCVKETLEDALEREKDTGTYVCALCNKKTLIWGSDFTFEEAGLEGDGVV